MLFLINKIISVRYIIPKVIRNFLYKTYTRYYVPEKYRKDIGKFTYGTPIIYDYRGGAGDLKIGNYCSITNDTVIFLGGEHKIEWVTTYPFSAFSDKWPNAKNIKGHPNSKGDVIIGNDVWIGHGVTILSGVTIGDGAVIGAGSVVIKDIEPYTIAGGSPARPIRKRFSDEVIRKLLKIAWWDWPVEKVQENVNDLCSENIDAFIKRHYKESVSKKEKTKNGKLKAY
jgi:acetyltransferase-like isoleucine patch superfamily enzyme